VGFEPDHDELEEMLRLHSARVEPVPPPLLAAAERAFAWREIHSHLAELVFDSLLVQDETVLVRGSPQPRHVSFKTGELTIDVEVTSTGPGRAVLGQIIPTQRATVDIRHAQGCVTVEADDLGRFQSSSLPAGPMSLRLSLTAEMPGNPVVTDWVSL
jgi:hypothetical protein